MITIAVSTSILSESVLRSFLVKVITQCPPFLFVSTFHTGRMSFFKKRIIACCLNFQSQFNVIIQTPKFLYFADAFSFCNSSLDFVRSFSKYQKIRLFCKHGLIKHSDIGIFPRKYWFYGFPSNRRNIYCNR